MLRINITLSDQEIEWLRANEHVGDLIDFNKTDHDQIETAVHKLIHDVLNNSYHISSINI